MFGSLQGSRAEPRLTVYRPLVIAHTRRTHRQHKKHGPHEITGRTGHQAQQRGTTTAATRTAGTTTTTTATTKRTTSERQQRQQHQQQQQPQPLSQHQTIHATPRHATISTIANDRRKRVPSRDRRAARKTRVASDVAWCRDAQVFQNRPTFFMFSPANLKI